MQKREKSYTNKITIKSFSSPLFFQVFPFSTIYIFLISYIFLQCTVCLQYKDPYNKEITISLSSSWNSLTFSVSEDRRGQQHFFGALTSFRTLSFFCPTHTHTHFVCMIEGLLLTKDERTSTLSHDDLPLSQDSMVYVGTWAGLDGQSGFPQKEQVWCH